MKYLVLLLVHALAQTTTSPTTNVPTVVPTTSTPSTGKPTSAPTVVPTTSTPSTGKPTSAAPSTKQPTAPAVVEESSWLIFKIYPNLNCTGSPKVIPQCAENTPNKGQLTVSNCTGSMFCWTTLIYGVSNTTCGAINRTCVPYDVAGVCRNGRIGYCSSGAVGRNNNIMGFSSASLFSVLLAMLLLSRV